MPLDVPVSGLYDSIESALDQPYPVVVGSHSRRGFTDNSQGFGSSGFTRGQLIALPAMTVNALYVAASVTSSGATSSTMTLYKITDRSTSTNVLVAQSADKGAVETGLNLLTYPLTLAYNAAAGLYYIGFQVAYSTTAPSFMGWVNGNTTLSGLHPILATGATGGAFPAALSTTAAAPGWWVGVS